MLDVSWNLLHDHHSDVAIIKKHIHNIQSLDIRHNNNTKCNEVMNIINNNNNNTKCNEVMNIINYNCFYDNNTMRN